MQARRLGLGAITLAVMLLLAAVLSSARALSATEVRASQMRAAQAQTGRGIAVTPVVTGASVRLPLVPGRPAAGYLTLTGGAKPDRLIGVSSPLAGRIEMHSVAMAGGVMRMRAEPAFDLPAGGALRFASGGNHLMLFDLKPGAKPGAQVPLRLTFQSGATLDTLATAESGAPKPDAYAH